MPLSYEMPPRATPSLATICGSQVFLPDEIRWSVDGQKNDKRCRKSVELKRSDFHCRYQEARRAHMLRWTLTFLVIALIAALFGFGGIAVAAAGIARILFFIFIVLFLVSIVSSLVRKA
jgi:uncharacterized membrane protein YtjA (UPF0391 family)